MHLQKLPSLAITAFITYRTQESSLGLPPPLCTDCYFDTIPPPTIFSNPKYYPHHLDLPSEHCWQWKGQSFIEGSKVRPTNGDPKGLSIGISNGDKVGSLVVVIVVVIVGGSSTSKVVGLLNVSTWLFMGHLVGLTIRTLFGVVLSILVGVRGLTMQKLVLSKPKPSPSKELIRRWQGQIGGQWFWCDGCGKRISEMVAVVVKSEGGNDGQWWKWQKKENKQCKIERRDTGRGILWGRVALQFFAEFNVYFVVWYNTVS